MEYLDYFFILLMTCFLKYVFQCFQDEPMDTDQNNTFLSSIQSEIAKYQLLIEEENQKLKRYKVNTAKVAR